MNRYYSGITFRLPRTGKVWLASILAVMFLFCTGAFDKVRASETDWTPVGPSSPGYVQSFLEADGELYAVEAGPFIGYSSSISKKFLWTYNNGTWTQVSDPKYGNTDVTLLYVTEAGGTLYAETTDGLFTYSNGVWTRLSDSPDSSYGFPISSLVEFNGELYAANMVSGAYDIDHFWKYNGNVWNETTDFPNQFAFPHFAHAGTLLFNVNGVLYAGSDDGVYTYTDSDGTWTWTRMVGSPVYVNSLIEKDGMLFASGSTDYYSGHKIWTNSGGTTWTQMSSSPSKVNTLYNMNGTLYAGAEDGVYTYNGAQWELMSGSPEPVQALIERNGTLFAGSANTVWTYSNGIWEGSMSKVLSLINVNGTLYAAKYGNASMWTYNSGKWWYVPGSPSYVYSLFEADGKLYAGTIENGIWSYSNGTWTQMIGSTGGIVTSLIERGGVLYAGVAQGDDNYDVYTYNGTQWELMDGSPVNIISLAEVNGTLYAIGQDQGVFQYDDNDEAWTKISGSLDTVNSLLEVNGTLYVGGYDGVYQYDGSTWPLAPENGSPTGVLSLLEVNGILYAGTFDGVYLYDGSAWMPMNGPPVYAQHLLEINATLYAAGYYGVYQTLIPPGKPVHVQTGNTTSTSTLLTWDAVPGATGYNIYQDGSNTTLDTVTGDTYSLALSGLVPDTSYTFTVSAFNPAGESSLSDAVDVWTTLSPPTELTAAADDARVALSWEPVAGATGYNVYMRVEGTSYGAAAATVSSGTEYTMTGLANRTKYYFVVKASNARGEGDSSDEVSATPYRLTLTYDSNGATSGIVPVDSGIYMPGDTLSVSGNTGNLAKTGYTFNGWNTRADGSGMSYDPGETLTMGTSNVTLYARWLSENALLSGTSVDQGTLSPAFAASVTNYRVEIANAVSSLNLFIVKGDPYQTISVTNAVYDSVTNDVYYSYRVTNLAVGENPIQIQVAAENGTRNVYHLTIYRISNNADLSGLTLSNGTLSPAFDATKTAYTASVPNSVASLTVTPITAEANATVTASVNEGTAFSVATGQASEPLALNVGTNTIKVAVTAQDGTTTKTYTITVTRAESLDDSSSGGGGALTPTEQPVLPVQTDLPVIFNGHTGPSIATATTSKQNGKTVLTATIDTDKLVEQLAPMDDRPVVTIPVTADADQVTAVLTGDAIKAMANKNATLEVHTPNGSYKLPASEVLIGQLSEQFGAQTKLSDITVHVDIARSDDAKVQLIENAADKGGFTLVVPPVNFTVTVLHGDQTVNVDTFSSYVEREIPLPDGIDASQITTAVVLNEDGVAQSVPTRIITRDGKTYAVISSLTNSTYALISHPVAFQDVENHWAKDAVNNMGSRMVISGVGNGLFSPDREITRAEFAAIIVRGLGLKPVDGANPFSDVKAADWYSSAVKTASVFGLITGFEDGTFRPNDKISREQAMVIFAKAMEITKLAGLTSDQTAEKVLQPFSDAKEVSSWAKSGMASSVQAGIVSGRGSMNLAPKDFMTRAEVATIIEQLLKKSHLI